MYAKATAKEQAGEAGASEGDAQAESAKADDDDVVDADFEEVDK